MSTSSVIAEVASVATAVGVLGAFASLASQTRARKFSLAQAYISRYWTIDDDIRRAEAGADLALLSMHQQRYLRLSEDEYELARLGWISDRVWREWHSAIRRQSARYLSLPVPSDAPDKYERLVRCLNDPDTNHQPYDCDGVRDRTWFRRVLWRLERITGG